MKKLLVVLIVFLTYNVFCQASGAGETKGLQTDVIKYVPIDSFTTNNRINIINIDDYIQFVNDKKIDIVFVSNNTFVCEFNSVLYAIPTNGYKTLNDFSNGYNKEFEDGSSFYLAIEQELTSQSDVNIYRQDLEKANSLGFFSIVDYRDALASGFLNLENRNNYITISGIMRKNELEHSIYYLNALLGLTDKHSNDIIDKPSEYIDKGIMVYISNYYNIQFTFNNNQYGKGYNENDMKFNDSRFYYACKLANYNTADDLVANNNLNNANTHGVVYIKNTETIYKELHYESHSDFWMALNGGFNNNIDYYFAKKYNIRTNNDFSTNKQFLNDIEKIKQNYHTDNNGYALVIYQILRRPKAIPVSIDVFTKEYSDEYYKNNYRSLNIPFVSFDVVYSSNAALRSMIIYDQTGKSFYLK